MKRKGRNIEKSEEDDQNERGAEQKGAQKKREEVEVEDNSQKGKKEKK